MRFPNEAERLIADPLEESLHVAIRRIGKYLFETGGVDRMRRVLEMAAVPRSRRYGQRATILDHKWDSIGGEWWC